jgi:hypothetical protein
VSTNKNASNDLILFFNEKYTDFVFKRVSRNSFINEFREDFEGSVISGF